jgi:hypothetical protein
MKELGIVLDFKSKTIAIDEITLPMRNIILLQGSSTLRALKLNYSLTKESLSTLDGRYQTCNQYIRCQICKSRSPVNCKEQLQASKCRQSEKVTAAPR